MSNYSLVKLKDLIINITDNRGKTPPLVESGIELIETPSLRGDNKYVDFSKISKYVSRDTYETWFRSGHPKNGDILITLVGTIGKVCIFKDNRGCIAQNIVALEFSERCNSEFMYYYLSSPIMQNQISFLNRQSAQPNLKLPDFINLPVNLPPLKEQQKIAEILSSVDAAIEKTEQVIAKTEEVKKGLMQQLLTKGIGHTEFKQTEIGEIPVEWEILNLEKLVEILDGKRKPIKKGDRISGNYPYYGATGIIDWVNDYIFDEDLILVGEDGENLKSRLLPMAFKVSGKIWVNNHAHVLKPMSKINIDFLVNWLEFIDYTDYITGTAQPKLNQQQLKKIKVVCPKLDEQIKIAAIINNIDIKISSERKWINNLMNLKQGLMQQLLTGEMRVKID